MRLVELLESAALQLEKAGVAESQLEARLLLEACLAKTRTELFLLGQTEVPVEDEARYIDLINRRKQREPVAYILKEQEFWSMQFLVTPAVLIPRPETEFLLDRVLALVNPQNLRRGHLLDLCCGSGVIATVLARETGEDVFAVDLSRAALAVTRSNLQRHNLLARVAMVQADLFSAFSHNRQFSLIVSNPPYVSSFDIEHTLEPEVAEHEPRLALDGGDGGMDIIRRIRRDVSQFMCPGGQLFMEIGADQGEEVRLLFAEEFDGSPAFEKVDILVDYADRDRVLHATIRNN
ncbi:MAG: peptide chain release factor N(5)-glutamine methyltransferase [Desulforhopalus sp.]|nr:peptide chain release factor N(5)-glutamine methyltransferase [Desulforhopalus sp.]